MSDENKGKQPDAPVSDSAQVDSDEVRKLKRKLRDSNIGTWSLISVMIIFVVMLGMGLWEKNVEAANRDYHYFTPLIAYGHYDSVKDAIDQGFNFNARCTHSSTSVLQSAIGSDEPEIALLLIASGADIGNRNTLGETALHYAAQDGQVDVVKALLSKGADPTLEGGSDDSTPLEHAVKGRLRLDTKTEPARDDDYADVIALLEEAMAASSSST